MAKSANIRTQPDEAAVRQVSPQLIVGICLLPFVFAWFLLGKGYSAKARAIGFGWAGFAVLVALVNQPPHPPTMAGSKSYAPARTAFRERAVKPRPAMAAAAPSAPRDPYADENRYIDMLNNTVRDIKREGFIRQEDTAQTTWAVAVQTIGNVATMYDEGAKYQLTDKGRASQAEFRKDIGILQTRDFPRLRRLYAKALGERLWEHDITVKTDGPANSRLLLTGFIFGTNRAIKAVMEAANEDALAVRYKRVAFRAYEDDGITTYTLEPLSDATLATFAFNRWTPVMP